MSDALLGILLVAAIVGAIILWQKFTSAVGKKATQTLRPKDHKAGQELVSQRRDFVVAAPVRVVRNAILQKIPASPNGPGWKFDLHLVDSSESFILFEYRSKIQSAFRMLVAMEATEDGAKGSFEIANWTLVDGIVSNQKEIRTLISNIENALKSLDSTATIRVVQSGN